MRGWVLGALTGLLVVLAVPLLDAASQAAASGLVIGEHPSEISGRDDFAVKGSFDPDGDVADDDVTATVTAGGSVVAGQLDVACDVTGPVTSIATAGISSLFPAAAATDGGFTCDLSSVEASDDVTYTVTITLTSGGATSDTATDSILVRARPTFRGLEPEFYRRVINTLIVENHTYDTQIEMTVDGTPASCQPPTPANKPGDWSCTPRRPYPAPGRDAEITVRAVDPSDSTRTWETVKTLTIESDLAVAPVTSELEAGGGPFTITGSFDQLTGSTDYAVAATVTDAEGAVVAGQEDVACDRSNPSDVFLAATFSCTLDGPLVLAEDALNTVTITETSQATGNSASATTQVTVHASPTPRFEDVSPRSYHEQRSELVVVNDAPGTAIVASIDQREATCDSPDPSQVPSTWSCTVAGPNLDPGEHAVTVYPVDPADPTGARGPSRDATLVIESDFSVDPTPIEVDVGQGFTLTGTFDRVAGSADFSVAATVKDAEGAVVAGQQDVPCELTDASPGGLGSASYACALATDESAVGGPRGIAPVADDPSVTRPALFLLSAPGNTRTAALVGDATYSVTVTETSSASSYTASRTSPVLVHGTTLPPVDPGPGPGPGPTSPGPTSPDPTSPGPTSPNLTGPGSPVPGAPDAGPPDTTGPDTTSPDATGPESTDETPDPEQDLASGEAEVTAAGSDEAEPPLSGRTTTLLTLGIAGMTMVGLSGARGLARSSVAGAGAPAHRTVALAEREEGDTDRDITLAEREGPGDRSPTWRLPGHALVDRVSRAAPAAVSPRSPFLGRLAADGSQLRAMFGIAWTVAPIAGLVLAAAALTDTSTRALPPALGLVVALTILSSLDALAGAVATGLFVTGVLVTGGLWDDAAPDLVHSLLVLLALSFLWTSLPLIGAAIRPFRRLGRWNARYAWDRLADLTIASLLCAWVAQELVESMDLFAGVATGLPAHANLVALVVLVTTAARIAVEHTADAWYPGRLGAVETPGSLPSATSLADAGGVLLRSAVFAFIGYAFIGVCWQWWVGCALFTLPQIVGLFQGRLRRRPSLVRLLPKGLIEVFVLLLACTLAVRVAIDSTSSDGEAVRLAFMLLALPPAALGLLGLLADEEQPRGPRPWIREILGLVILVGCMALALYGWDI